MLWICCCENKTIFVDWCHHLSAQMDRKVEEKRHVGSMLRPSLSVWAHIQQHMLTRENEASTTERPDMVLLGEHLSSHSVVVRAAFIFFDAACPTLSTSTRLPTHGRARCGALRTIDALVPGIARSWVKLLHRSGGCCCDRRRRRVSTFAR